MSAPTYQIRTIADMTQIPRDRWAAFAADLEICVNTLRAAHDALGLPVDDTRLGALTWTDDGALGGAVRLQTEAGEPLCTIHGGPDA